MLFRKGDLDGAVAAYRECTRVGSADANVHYNLGVLLQMKGDLDGAMASWREAIRLDPNLATAHTNRGNALIARGDIDGAIACYHEAIRADPSLTQAHLNLGRALGSKGDLKGSVAAFREAARLAPDAHTQYNIGNALLQQGDVAGAILSYREAIRVDPNLAEAHTNLGNALKKRGDVAGAIASYREAIRVKPDLAFAHANLGDALDGLGDLGGALASYKRAVSLAPADPGLRAWLDEAEQRFAAARARLPAVLKGEDRPRDAAEWRTLAGVAHLEKDYPASARCWREAFESDPRLAADLSAGNRYDAACAAALAGPEWRGQALDWLRADLRAWQERPRSDAEAVASALRHWKADPDLAGVRDADGLPDGWRSLWADVDALLARAGKAR